MTDHRNVWISDCKQYVCRTRPSELLEMPDVFDRAGNVWRGGRYKPTGWEDTDPRFVYPEFPRMVTFWGNLGRRKRSGEWVPAFRLGFCEFDQTLPYRQPGVDARIGETLTADFHRRCPPLRPPRWVREIMESAEWEMEI
jgi:hypothetical protein